MFCSVISYKKAPFFASMEQFRDHLFQQFMSAAMMAMFKQSYGSKGLFFEYIQKYQIFFVHP